MLQISNKQLWSKAGFVAFEDRHKAVDFWNACSSRAVAVQGGRGIGHGFAFYYIAKAGDEARKRVEDYAVASSDLYPWEETV